MSEACVRCGGDLIPAAEPWSPMCRWNIEPAATGGTVARPAARVAGRRPLSTLLAKSLMANELAASTRTLLRTGRVAPSEILAAVDAEIARALSWARCDRVLNA